MNECYDSYLEVLPEGKRIMEWALKMEVMIKAHSFG